MLQFVFKLLLYLFTAVVLWSIRILKVIRTQKTINPAPLKILITGTFYSDQWLITHLVPLAESARVAKVTMVADRTVPPMAGVEPLYPPEFLMKTLGGTMARTLYFLYIGMTSRDYDVIGGFHLLLNGMLSALLAALNGTRSLYICGGGPREVLGGGFETENRLYGRLSQSSSSIERQLIEIVKRIDLVICMGHSATRYFRDQDVQSQLEVVPGGFDGSIYHPASVEPEFDLILIGRLSAVKQVDLFIQCIKSLRTRGCEAKAAIVGDGPDLEQLEKLSRELGVDDLITFCGWQNNVGDWLRKSRVFVLTSESEGLSQALIQAMLCGLPAVVSDVGDLGDLVSHNENGYLVHPIEEGIFVDNLEGLLTDAEKYASFRQQAISSTRQYLNAAVSESWSRIL